MSHHTLSAFIAPAPKATFQHVTSSNIYIICIYSTSTYSNMSTCHIILHIHYLHSQHQHLQQHVIMSHHLYTLSAFTAPAPTATCQHVTSSYMHIICIHSTSTYAATFQHHMHHTERAPIQHQHLLHNILCSNGTLLVITAAVPEARAFSKYCYWTCKHNEVLFSLVCSFKISERPPKDLPLCPSSHCRFRGHNVRPRNQR